MRAPVPAWQQALFERRTLGVRLGLDAVRRVDAALGHPASGVPALQVVGTNGKGSTVAMLAALLRHACDGPWGVYTSPHLHRVGERVAVAGRAISDTGLHAHVERIEEAERRVDVRLSFFEVLTLSALLEFEAAKVSGMILEAGLGGRLDATRLRPASVVGIARIDLDHQEYLGNTLAEIAAEKVAVIEPGARAFTVPQASEAMAVIEAHVRSVGAVLQVVSPTTRPPRMLGGEHQRMNAGLALAMAHAMTGVESAAITDLDDVRVLGRAEWIERDGVRVIFDVAHNPAGLRALGAHLSKWGKPSRVLIGWHGAREADEMLNACPRGQMMGWVPLDGGPEPPTGMDWSVVFEGPEDPRIQAWMAVRGGPVLVCGSHRVVGPIRARWAGAPVGDPPGLTDPT